MAYHDDVFRYAMARLNHREDAEDVASEIVQALPNPCYRRDLRPYMIGMARRKVVDHLRRAKDTVPIGDVDGAARFDSQADQSAMVGSTLATLSDDHREVLVLKYVVGLSSAEIANVLGKRSEAIDSLLQRARASFGTAWTRITSEEVEW